MSLNGVETAVKITGMAAKHFATLLYTILSDQKRTKGRVRLSTMLKTGEPQKIFSIKQSDLKTFVKTAKKYGILYHVTRKVKGAPDQFADVIVSARDAGKVSRIIERFKFADVRTADVQTEVLRDREERADAGQPEPEKTVPEKNETEKLLDEMLGKPIQAEKNHTENPTRTSAAENPRPSEVFSGSSADMSRTDNKEGKSSLSYFEPSKKQRDDRGQKRSVISELKNIQSELHRQEQALPQPQLTRKPTEKGR